MGFRRGGSVVASLSLLVMAVTGCSDGSAACEPQRLLDEPQTEQDVVGDAVIAELPNIDGDSSRLLAELADPEGRIYVARDGDEGVCLVVDVSTVASGCTPEPVTHLTVSHPSITVMLTGGVATEELAADGWELLDAEGCLAIRS